jgi:hypothetical protein
MRNSRIFRPYINLRILTHFNLDFNECFKNALFLRRVAAWGSPSQLHGSPKSRRRPGGWDNGTGPQGRCGSQLAKPGKAHGYMSRTHS